MKKQEFIKAIAKKVEITQEQASATLSAMIDIVTAELKAGEEVNISGFGTFGVTHRAERMGINPKTGEKIKIAAGVSPKFKALKGLKDGIK